MNSEKTSMYSDKHMIEQAKVALFYIVSCLVYFIQPKLVYVISTR